MNDASRTVATPAGEGFVLLGPLGAAHVARALTLVEREYRQVGASPSPWWRHLRDAINQAAAFAYETAKAREEVEVPSSGRVCNSARLSTERAAKMANCSTQWVRSLCRTGAFASARRSGNAWSLDESEVAAWVAERAAHMDAAA